VQAGRRGEGVHGCPQVCNVKRHGLCGLCRVWLIRIRASVIRRLPRDHRVTVEKGLLRTFGRVMPALMTLCVVLSIVHAARAVNVNALHWLSAVAFTLALVSTLIFNVPINRATCRWDPANPPENWKEVRNKWEFFQGLRAWLLRPAVRRCLDITAWETQRRGACRPCLEPIMFSVRYT
jgi:hypothetical protein